MATIEGIKGLIVESKKLWAEAEELEARAREKRIEYHQVRGQIGEAIAALKYGVSFGDTVNSKRQWGRKRGEEVTIKVDAFPFRVYSDGDMSVEFEGYIIRKDGSVGQRRATVYPDSGFTIVSKATATA